MANRGRIRIEDSAKMVRGYIDGALVVTSTRPRLVWEKPYYPTYYFRMEDVTPGVLEESETTSRSPSRGTARHFDLRVGDRSVADGAYSYPDSPIDDLVGYVSFAWDKLDRWFEEDEEVYVHARDPYTRVDILPSSRHIRVSVAEHTVAESHHARLLFETGLPARYYLPKTDVAMDMLVATDHTTACPYKGTANYWSVVVDGTTFENIAWGYQHPTSESQRIAGLISFYNEKVEIYVDGELEERPATVFS